MVCSDQRAWVLGPLKIAQYRMGSGNIFTEYCAAQTSPMMTGARHITY